MTGTNTLSYFTNNITITLHALFFTFAVMLKQISLLLCFLAPLFHFAQNIVQVDFNEPAYDERYHKSKQIIPVFKYTGNSIEEYEKFGIEQKKLESFSIKQFPDMKEADDTAYGFIYYSGAPADINRGYITFLLNNHRRWGKPAILHIDRNNNLDFTDDGAADTLGNFTFYIDVKLPHPKFPAALYTVRLSRFDLNKDTKYRSLMDDYYRKNQGNKVFAGIDYSFKENRQNMRGATYNGEQDTFRLALYDGNYDGLYTNAEYDQIFVAKQGDTIFLDDFALAIDEKIKNTEFEWNYKVYRVTDIDPAGRYIKFFWDKDAISKKALRIGKKIPKFTFYLHDSKTTKKIKKYRSKGLYIYFYNTENPTFEQDTATLSQIHSKYGNCINIVTLNFGDYYKTISAMKVLDGIPYTVGLSNRELNRTFNIEKLPTGFLCRKRLRLAHKDISPQEVLELLNKGDKK